MTTNHAQIHYRHDFFVDMPQPPLSLPEELRVSGGISFRRLALSENLSATQQDIEVGGLFAEMETQQRYVCAVLSPASAKENKSFFAEEGI